MYILLCFSKLHVSVINGLIMLLVESSASECFIAGKMYIPLYKYMYIGEGVRMFRKVIVLVLPNFVHL